jgi:hypothetical protein
MRTCAEVEDEIVEIRKTLAKAATRRVSTTAED